MRSAQPRALAALVPLLRGCFYSLKTDKIRPLETGKEVISFSTRNLGQDTEYVTNV